MQVALNIKDEAMYGQTQPRFAIRLHFPTNHISVRELIEARVREEVALYNAKQPEVFNMLVQPALAERVLNGFKFKEKKRINEREQYEKAIQAFDRNGFIILVDDLQVESLDQIIEISPETTVSFLKLVPLVGG
ncbi:MAG TPA: hypothetical protein VNB22_06020 [Pyrinomonadaceae bacterium]|jgi:hypothetical protein|nr:hypothetical protein [Pyrinomonadaceae bacterium]